MGDCKLIIVYLVEGGATDTEFKSGGNAPLTSPVPDRR